MIYFFVNDVYGTGGNLLISAFCNNIDSVLLGFASFIGQPNKQNSAKLASKKTGVPEDQLMARRAMGNPDPINQNWQNPVATPATPGV